MKLNNFELKKDKKDCPFFAYYYALIKNSLEYSIRYTTLLQIVIITINTFFFLFFSQLFF